MSKIDAMRAMREARYAERAKADKPPANPARRPTAVTADPQEPVAPEPAAAEDALCGHRSMNGRTCTREHGHAAKNHRYS
jgi:hypothetical protein